MATKTDKTTFRGLGIPDPRTLTADALWEAESTYDQAGPTAGVPEAQQTDGGMVLKARGDQKTDTVRRIRLQDGGYPGTEGATAIWQVDGASSWYGWQPPYVLTGYQHLAQDNDDGHFAASLLTLQSGDVLQVGCRGPGFPTFAERYSARRYDAASAGWQAVVTIADLTHPTLNSGLIDAVQLPDGRILAIYLVEDEITGKTQISVASSTDNAATWSAWATYSLSGDASAELAASADINRLRAAYQHSTGEILLCLWYENGGGSHTNSMQQWASRDLGHTFEYVTAIDGDSATDISISGGVIAIDGGFQVWSVNPAQSAATPAGGLEYWELGSAFDAVGDGNTGTPYAVANFAVSSTVADNVFGVTVTDDGVPFVVVGNTNATIDNLHAARVGIGGYRGGVQTSGYGTILQPGVSTVHPIDISIAWHRGRLIMTSNHDSPTTTADDRALTVLYFGGHETQPHGLTFFSSYSGALGRFDRSPEFVAGWSQAWVPWELPDNDGWTAATTGTTTAAITASTGLLDITTTGTGTRYYQVSPASMGERTRVWGVVEVTTGIASVAVVHNDGSTDHEIMIEIATDGSITMRNDPGGVNTLIATLPAVSGPVEFRAEIDTSNAQVWSRAWTPSEKRAWTNTASGAVTNAVGTPAGRVWWGCTGSTSDAASWHCFAYATGDEAGESLIDQTLPGDLRGFPVPAAADGVLWIDEGVEVYAVDGPGGGGDEWTVSTRYEYPISRIFPQVSPSPALGWRSANQTAGMAIAWREHTSYTSHMGWRVLHLEGINFRQAQIQARLSGVWTDVFEIDNTTSFLFTRTGNVITPGGGGLNTSGQYLHENELAGGYIELDPLVGTTKVRKITHNTAGSLFQSGDMKQARIYCEDIDDTEATSGTARIWHPRVTVIMPPSLAQGWRIQIDDDASPVQSGEGWYQISALFWGRIAHFGTDYSFSRTLSITPNTEITTARDGTRRARVNGKARRAVSFSFPAIDASPFQGSGTPDVIKTGATTTAYAARDEPVTLPGFVEYLRGAERLVLYLPRIDRFDSGLGESHGLHRARGAFLGRLIGGVTLTQIAGDEEKDDVLSIGTVTIEEEV
jgi:hypothetical protein